MPLPHETATALDPQVKAVIDLVIKSGRPAFHQLSPKDARQMYRETRPASTPPAPEIGEVKDLAADGPAGPIPLRLYRPKGVTAGTALPVLVFFHGGGWVIGDLDTHDVLCRQLTAGAPGDEQQGERGEEQVPVVERRPLAAEDVIEVARATRVAEVLRRSPIPLGDRAEAGARQDGAHRDTTDGERGQPEGDDFAPPPR